MFPDPTKNPILKSPMLMAYVAEPHSQYRSAKNLHISNKSKQRAEWRKRKNHLATYILAAGTMSDPVEKVRKKSDQDCNSYGHNANNNSITSAKGFVLTNQLHTVSTQEGPKQRYNLLFIFASCDRFSCTKESIFNLKAGDTRSCYGSRRRQIH